MAENRTRGVRLAFCGKQQREKNPVRTGGNKTKIHEFPHRGQLVEMLYHILGAPQRARLLWLVIFWVSYETRACARFIGDPERCAQRVGRESRSDREEAKTGIPAQRRVRLSRLPTDRARPQGASTGSSTCRSSRSSFWCSREASLFDAMDFPLPLIFVTGLALAYALHTARVVAQQKRQKMRGRALKYYEEKRSTPAWPSINTEPIDRLMERISNTHAGAFVYLAQQPAASAALAVRWLREHADYRIPVQALACSPLNHATSTPSARNVTGNIWVHVSRLAR